MSVIAGPSATGEALAALVRPHPAPMLPAFQRLAPPPPEHLIGAEIEARSKVGDVVIDLHARGGWIARAAVARLRRGYSVESEPLTRLLADLVLRPPDLRHFDAAVNALAIQPYGDIGLRQALNDLFASRCHSCGRAVVVEEFVWEGDAPAPTLKSYRCSSCRDRSGTAHPRHVPADEEDAARAAGIAGVPTALQALRGRFPVPDSHSSVPDQLLALYTPRTAVALEGLVSRLEGSRRAPSIEAALRLALVHVLLPVSRLNSYPGRIAALRIVNGRVRSPGDRQWRERNPWLVFEEGCRLVRGFIQWLEAAGGHAAVQARFGDDLLALADGSANAVVKLEPPALETALPVTGLSTTSRASSIAGLDATDRVRLVLTEPPLHRTSENLSFGYLATSIALGHQAASTLRLDAIFGPVTGAEWDRDASELRRSLLTIGSVVAPDAQLVVVVDRAAAPVLVAAVLGAVGGGWALGEALLIESLEGISGTLLFARRSDARASGESAQDAPEPLPAADAAAAVADVAVGVLQQRGEAATYERLLGEVLVGLDQRGYLRRFAATRRFDAAAGDPEQTTFDGAAEAASAAATGDVPARLPALWRDGVAVAVASGNGTHAGGNGHHPTDPPDPRGRRAATTHDIDGELPAGEDIEEVAAGALDEREAAGASSWAVGSDPGGDHVGLLLDIVLGELRRPGHPRLYELEPGRWWLRDPQDVERCEAPLADRVEWAVFSLLSTSRGIAEPALRDRIFRMFRGHDTPEESLVAACLESYRSPGSLDAVQVGEDDLHARYREHGELVGLIAEYGARLGLRRWISPREQRRTYRGRPLADLLTAEERDAHPSRIARGDPEAIQATDCIWYLPRKAAFLFEVEWTAMVAEPLLVRGPRIATDEGVVRFLVVAPERAELLRLKLARSPVLRQALEDGNWHILKADHLRRLVDEDDADLARLGPLLGLDPEVEKKGEQLALFG